MLELSKKVLERVSFDAKLFHKELLKALTWLQTKEEIERLKNWCMENFGQQHPMILSRVF